MSIAKRERWTEVDVDALPAGEHDYFDRKSGGLFDKDKRGEPFPTLAKAVSAFANSGGGHLVLGVNNAGTPDGVPALEGRTPIREWLEQHIPDLVSYPLSEFRVHVVERSEPSRIPTDRQVVVIDIGDSQLAPHQCVRGGAGVTLGVYYHRQGGRSVPARHFYLELLRSRRTRPELELRLRTNGGLKKPDGSGFEVPGTFDVVNMSQATATFAVITVAVRPRTSVTWGANESWRYLLAGPNWTILRNVIASGSSPLWSPITPGFAVSPDYLVVHVGAIHEPEGTWRTVGLARLDHDGAPSIYRIDFTPNSGIQLRLVPLPSGLDPDQIDDWHVPEMFILAH